MSLLSPSFRNTAFRMLHFSTRMAPPAVRPWGEAMLGEFAEIPAGWASLRWGLGGALVLWRETVSQALRGDQAKQASSLGHGPRFSEDDMKKLFPFMGLAFLLFTVIMLFNSPVLREGIHAGVRGWAEMFRNGDVSSSQMRSLVAAGRSERDASTLAFAAFLESDPQARIQLAREAVAMDPNLAWILPSSLGRFDSSEATAIIDQLQKKYPQNGAVYELAAYRRSRLPDMAKLSIFDLEQWQSHADWMAEMDKAFSAPSYDEFLGTSFNLARSVLKKRNIDDPLLLIYSTWLPRGPAVQSEQVYSRILIQQAEQASRKGDNRTAAALLWKVQRFGRMLHAGVYSDWARSQASSIIRLADLSLAPVLHAQGEVQEAQLLQNEAAEITADKAISGRYQDIQLMTNGQAATVIAVQSAAHLFLFTGIVALILLIRAFQKGAAPFTGLAAMMASALAMLCAWGTYISYAPVQETFNFYWTTEKPLDFVPLYVFAEFAEPLPARLGNFSRSALLLAVAVFLVVVVCSLAIWTFRRFRREPVAA